jgi:hypothetical protein
MAVDLVVGVRDGESHFQMLPTIHNPIGSSILNSITAVRVRLSATYTIVVRQQPIS